MLPGADDVRREARAAFLGVDVALFEERDRELDSHAGEFILWFEADLYDQLQIVEILARLGARGVDPERITLISVEVPGIAALIDASSPELRFVGEAFGRLAREYPSARDGLSLTERRMIAALPGTAAEAFVRGAAKEARPFLGDTFAFAALDRMEDGGLVARGNTLVRTDRGDRVLAGAEHHITDRWVGGVRMRETAWRWDEATERLVAGAEG